MGKDQLPANLPAPIKEQLRALSQFLIQCTPSQGGGRHKYIFEYAIPANLILEFDKKQLEVLHIDYNLIIDPSDPYARLTLVI